MTQDELERFQKVMVEKYRRQLDWYPTQDEGLHSIIGGVIADMSLLLDGTLSLEDWEQALAKPV